MKLSNAVTAGLAVWNYLINRRIRPRHYVASNLAASAVLVALGSRLATPRQLGLHLERGLPIGLAGAGVVALGSVVASRLPATAHFFDDKRVSRDDVTYQALVRIPLGTVVLEELAFRSVLPALVDGGDRSAPSLRSAALFGLWHVIPTINTLDINGVEDRRTKTAAVAAGVATTAVAGWVFDLLRLRSGSVVAPMLVHWSGNAFSYLLAARRISVSQV